MTTLHAKRRPILSTDELKRRTGQVSLDKQAQWYADVERRCEGLARQKRNRERRRWFLACLLLLATAAVLYGWLVPVAGWMP